MKYLSMHLHLWVHQRRSIVTLDVIQMLQKYNVLSNRFTTCLYGDNSNSKEVKKKITYTKPSSSARALTQSFGRELGPLASEYVLKETKID